MLTALLDSDSSALVQFDLFEQLNQSTETIIVMLAKNISAYFYALTQNEKKNEDSVFCHKRVMAT